MKSRVSLFFGLMVLLIATLFAVMPRNLQTYYAPDKPLAEWLPGSGNGWLATDRPIADSPEMKEAVDELLGFTDGIFRVYEKGGRQL